MPACAEELKTYDPIVRDLRAAGFTVEVHNFDKYQGDYFVISRGKLPLGTFWVDDIYFRGVRADADVPYRYRWVTMINSEGEEVSPNRGDYFFREPGIIIGRELRLCEEPDGYVNVIERPQVKDLPQDGEVRPKTFTYKEGTETTCFVLIHEEEEVSITVRIKPDGSTDIEMLTEYLSDLR